MTIDQELQAALDVDPSPEFVARVRIRVANEAASRSGRAWWLLPVAAMAAVVLAALVWRSPGAPPAARVDLVASRTVPTFARPMATLKGRRDATKRAAVAHGREPLAASAGAAVLIDLREARALRRIVFGGALDIESPYVGTSLAAIAIAPISIEPLPTGSEGVRP
jgi:hypothetical protein